MENLPSGSLSYIIQADTRDFVRLLIEETLQLDLVNDRVYRHGKSILSASGIFLDNEVNICSNKLCAVLGRDDPKDMFDLYTVFQEGDIDWGTMITEAAKKCALDPEVLEYRLSSFPLTLLDLLHVVDPLMVNEIKEGYPGMAEHILQMITE